MITSWVICISNLTDDESGEADALVNEPNSVSKQMLPAHVKEMHRNRDEGFETEFGVRTPICTSTLYQQLYAVINIIQSVQH